MVRILRMRNLEHAMLQAIVVVDDEHLTLLCIAKAGRLYSMVLRPVSTSRQT